MKRKPKSAHQPAPRVAEADIPAPAPWLMLLEGRAPWGQGFNFGPRNGVLEACRDLVRRTADRHGTKVSLGGWSLGGVCAREMAKELLALYAIADRLRQAPAHWKPFDVRGAQRWFFKTTGHAPLLAAIIL